MPHRRESLKRQHRSAGFTVTELVVVCAIVAILSTIVVASYGNMQKAQKLSVSTDRLVSTLHLARNLAISHNAVYHIRIEDYYIPADPATNSALQPLEFRNSPQQYVSIYCYPNINDAMKVTTEPDPNQQGGKDNWWNATPRLDGRSNLFGLPPNNYLVERVKLEAGTYAGIQDSTNYAAPSNALVSFYPDGSSGAPSGALTYFVTDNGSLWDRVSNHDDGVFFRDNKDGFHTAPGNDDRLRTNLDRHAAFFDTSGSIVKGHKNLRMVRVLKGGLIKVLKGNKDP